MRFKILGLAFLFLSSCGQPSEKIIDGQLNDTLTYYDNGNLKTYKKISSDSVFDINFYSRLQNEVVDSMYRYRPFQDTLLAYERYIYNNQTARQELDISRIKTDSGQYLQFALTKPRGEWISLYIKENKGHWKADTLIRGPMMTIEPRQIYLKDTGDSRIAGYVIDWGYFSRTDTIGSIGHIVNRFIEFETIGQ